MEPLRIHLEPIGGVAGDMFVAAVADAFPEHRAALLDLLVSLRMPVPASARLAMHRGGGLLGTRFVVKALPARAGSPGDAAAFRDAVDGGADPSHGDEHGHGQDHDHGHDHDHDHDDAHGHGHGRAHRSDPRHGHVHGYVHGLGHGDGDDPAPRPPATPTHPHPRARPLHPAPAAAEHRPGHVSHAWIVQWLHGAGLREPVRRHALGIFGELATSEAAVHGVPVDTVEFHEVGSWDSIIDIVAAAFLIDAVGPARWTCAPLPLGSGTVPTAHGVMPVPAPATLHLLRGLPVIDDGVPGERVTPTGAAIVRYLLGASSPRGSAGAPMTVGASGLGFGKRVLPDRPNALRCTAFVPAEAVAVMPATAPFEDVVDALEFEVDDQTAEDLAVGLERLREREDVLQVFQMPVFGKKGRMATRVHVVAREGAGEAVARACFVETTTIGLRCQRLERRTLARADVATSGEHAERLRVKLCERPNAVTAKAEMDDLACQPGGHAWRERMRRAAEARALGAHGPRDPHAEETDDEP
jgi:uncharacterized protein (DUF111 family)